MILGKFLKRQLFIMNAWRKDEAYGKSFLTKKKETRWQATNQEQKIPATKVPNFSKRQRIFRQRNIC